MGKFAGFLSRLLATMILMVNILSEMRRSVVTPIKAAMPVYRWRCPVLLPMSNEVLIALPFCIVVTGSAVLV